MLQDLKVVLVHLWVDFRAFVLLDTLVSECPKAIVDGLDWDVMDGPLNAFNSALSTTLRSSSMETRVLFYKTRTQVLKLEVWSGLVRSVLKDLKDKLDICKLEVKLGALRATTSSWRSIGSPLCPLRPWGAQAV